MFGVHFPYTSILVNTFSFHLLCPKWQKAGSLVLWFFPQEVPIYGTCRRVLPLWGHRRAHGRVKTFRALGRETADESNGATIHLLPHPWRGARQLLIFKPLFKVKEKSFPSSTMIAVGSGTLPLPTGVRTAGHQPSAGQQLYQLFQPRLQVCDKISIVLASCLVLRETITTASCLFQHSVRFEIPHFETWLTFKIPSNSKMSWFESLEKV